MLESDGYEVVDHEDMVGVGGFSRVYKILSTLAILDNHLIVKNNKERIVKIQTFNADKMQYLLDEVALTQKARNLHIKQPAIVKISEDEYKAYTVMRRLHGADLYSVIIQMYSNALSLTTSQRLKIIVNLLTRLKALHARGIVHRDIKPDNVMIDLNTGEMEIFDFGLSKLDTVDDSNSEVMQGTLGYMPLEVFRNERTTAKSDEFSMAIVIALLWYANEPGKTEEDLLNYKFDNIFNDENIDLNEEEKVVVLGILKNMSKHERDARYTDDESLAAFVDVRENYVNRKIAEWMANKPKYYALRDGLFWNIIHKTQPVDLDVMLKQKL